MCLSHSLCILKTTSFPEEKKSEGRREKGGRRTKGGKRKDFYILREEGAE
jgi:hypothetical protein